MWGVTVCKQSCWLQDDPSSLEHLIYSRISYCYRLPHLLKWIEHKILVFHTAKDNNYIVDASMINFVHQKPSHYTDNNLVVDACNKLVAQILYTLLCLPIIISRHKELEA